MPPRRRIFSYAFIYVRIISGVKNESPALHSDARYAGLLFSGSCRHWRLMEIEEYMEKSFIGVHIFHASLIQRDKNIIFVVGSNTTIPFSKLQDMLQLSMVPILNIQPGIPQSRVPCSCPAVRVLRNTRADNVVKIVISPAINVS